MSNGIAPLPSAPSRRQPSGVHSRPGKIIAGPIPARGEKALALDSNQ
jgi:hypothetical protein